MTEHTTPENEEHPTVSGAHRPPNAGASASGEATLNANEKNAPSALAAAAQMLAPVGQLFVPFARVSNRAVYIITGVWLACIYVYWTYFTSDIVPKPMDILASVPYLWTERHLFNGILASLSLNLTALCVSTAISFGLAYLSVLGAFSLTVKLLSNLRFVGMAGLTLVFGLMVQGRDLQVAMIVFGMSTFFVTSMLSVVGSVTREQLDHARSLGAGPLRVTYETVILGRLADALDTMRQNAAIGWVMLTMIETLVQSQGGMALLIAREYRQGRYDAVFAVQLHVLVIGLLMDFGIRYARKVLCPHADLKKGHG